LASKGEDHSILMFNDAGEPVRTIQPNDMSFQLDRSSNRQNRCGTKEKPPRDVINGWSGSATFEEDDFELDKLIDSLVNAYYAGQPIDRIEIMHTKYVPELGATRTYRYFGVRFGYTEDVTGQTEYTNKSVEFEATGRELVS